MARRPVTAGFTQQLPIRGAGAIAAMGGQSVIEDCAHTMGARWNAARLGNVGRARCLRTKTCKHLTSGEGAGLTLSNAEFMARAVIFSGPDRRSGRPEAVAGPKAIAGIPLQTPARAARMDTLRATVVRPQQAMIGDRVYARVECNLIAGLISDAMPGLQPEAAA